MNPTGADAASSVPDPHTEVTNPEFLPGAEAGPRTAERRAGVKRAASNGGARRHGVGGGNGGIQGEREGAEEASGGPAISASQEA
ncbi:hypothetical protein NDU88_004267 [Pleurodeles waltl]|uniref:Uncharacterized protein n=1 Tax=Pleurodeles waltl TaxID=8319 RepID=A0AAV7W9V7_PLEWA|nr:hypothetical protein NDU88_004267 [Pleurodeles waltl]